MTLTKAYNAERTTKILLVNANQHNNLHILQDEVVDVFCRQTRRWTGPLLMNQFEV